MLSIYAIAGLGGVLMVYALLARKLRPAILGLLSLGVAGGVWWYLDQENLLAWKVNERTDAAAMAELQQADLQSTPDRAPTSDWPQYRGPGRDGIVRGVALNPDWDAQPPEVVWRQPCGGGYSSVSVAEGKVYVFDYADNKERITCYDAATGEQRWLYAYPVEYSELSQGYAGGPRASPTINQLRIYTVGATGKFLCLEETGDVPIQLVWQKDLLAEFDAELPTWGVACSPLIDGDRVIVQPGGSEGTVVAYNRFTGEVQWRTMSEETGYSSPQKAACAGVPQIIVFTARHLAGLDPLSGQTLWSTDWRTQYNANIAMPVVVGDYIFISSGYGTGCALVQVSGSTGDLSVRTVFEKRRLLRNKITSSVVHDGHIYGFDESRGELKCISLTGDGSEPKEMWASTRLRGQNNLLLVGDHLLVWTDTGKLGLVAADPSEFRLLGEKQILDGGGECWACPAFADDRVYVRNAKEVACVKLAIEE